jgi:pimeloyl-ACP methyl ester carboxylesterase
VAELNETPVVFGADQNLVGIVTEPAAPRGPRPAVVILNAGIIHRVGPSRFAVGTARGLARAGHRVLRFDLSGIGDSQLAGEGSLEQIVCRDIRDAIDLIARDDGVILVGLCSGADNAFFVGADEPRVRGLVLIDPSLERTAGFRRRRLLAALKSPSSWWRVVSGRALLSRARSKLAPKPTRPPGYYGLLACTPDDARRRAAAMTRRGVRFLYVMTGGALQYCNSPRQVREAMPMLGPNLSVAWRTEADHVMTREADRSWLVETILGWIESGSAGGPAAVRQAADR